MARKNGTNCPGLDVAVFLNTMATTSDNDVKLEKNDPHAAQTYFQNKLKFTTGPVELDYAIENGVAVTIIDVRTKKDFDEGHVPGAISLPEEDWPSLRGVSFDRLNVLYCYSQVCHLAARAGAYIASRGYSAMELEGGFNTWKEYGYPVEKTGEEPSSRQAS